MDTYIYIYIYIERERETYRYDIYALRSSSRLARKEALVREATQLANCVGSSSI